MYEIVGKRILILGGTGSLGHELTDHFIRNNSIGIFSRDENKQWTMKREYLAIDSNGLRVSRTDITYTPSSINFYIGDVRNKISMIRAIRQFHPNIIIFAAAQKHIDICENEVSESIDTNILGIRNLVEILEVDEKAFPDLESVLFISTDKACNPVNVYGQCKAISEKIMGEAAKTITSIKFLCVRYGNVINSRGSLIPLFKEIGNDPNRKFFPVTVSGMTRFFMSLPQAVNLIETCLHKGRSGELWIYRAISLYIDHIARYFSEKYNKPVKIVGIRPGEKIHEELYSASEHSKSFEQDNFIVINSITPNIISEYKGLYSNSFVISEYIDALPYIEMMVNTGTFSKL